MKKSILYGISGAIALIVVGVAGYLIGNTLANKENMDHILQQGFYPVDTVMELNGYSSAASESYVYETSIANKKIVVEYSFDDQVCTKNEYEFSLENAYLYENDKYYVRKEILEEILNCNLSYSDGEVNSEEISFEPHEWTEKYAHLIAHAGGAARENGYVSYYTNSKEALIENYNLGHRVFEFDFYLTSDSQLAVAHDWNHQYLCDGTAPTAQ